MAEIVLTGLAANDPVPGEYVEVAFAQGPASLGTTTYKAVLIGNKLAAGAGSNGVLYGPDTPISMTGEDDAELLFGAGSELQRMVSRFVKNNPTTPLYAIAVAENGSATVATGDITFVGTATQSGAVRIYVDDEFVDVGFVTGDTATVIATNAVTQVNAKGKWRVTASNVAGVLTLTSKQKGPRANLIRFFARVQPFQGTGITVTPVASTLTTGGSAADDLSTILSVLEPERFYYIIPAANDLTQLAALFAQINAQAAPIVGLRQRMVAGSVDTLANAITVVDGLNGARAELVWQLEGDIAPGEIAAHQGAIYALEESPSVPTLNFNFYGQGDGQAWQLKAPLSGAKPTRSQVYAALNAGVTPIAVQNGSAYLVKRITTRYKSGAVVDYRVRDAHKVTVPDRYGDDLVTKAALTMRGKSIGDDPKKAEPGPGPKVVTPRVVKAMINALTDVYNGNDLLQNVDEIKAQTLVLRDSNNKTRMGAKVPLQVVDILDQLAFRVDQVA